MFCNFRDKTYNAGKIFAYFTLVIQPDDIKITQKYIHILQKGQKKIFGFYE